MELLSPAGSPEALRAAVLCGADAVYVGAPQFNARAGAKNFTPDELKSSIDFAHKYGVKVHVALNTLVSDIEVKDFLETVRISSDAGADALIVQDLGMLSLIRRAMPDMPVHASTQMSVHSLDGVLSAAKLGASRVILARELDRDNIAYIAKHSPVEIEVFAHGAMCMSHSGQCLFSAMIARRSGNRGRCGQPCRLLYTREDGSGGSIMSLKDMCLASHIDELKSMGVASLKIEGRLKRPEYVALVTHVYRNIIDEGGGPTPPQLRDLNVIFSREGFSDGYYTKKTGADMFGMHKDNAASPEYKDVLKRARALYEGKTYVSNKEVHMTFLAKLSEPSRLFVRDNQGRSVFSEGEMPEGAKTRPLTREAVRSQLEKTGGTEYKVSRADIEIDDGISLKLSSINAMRREALEKLSKQGAKSPPIFTMPELLKKSEVKPRMYGITVGVDDISRLPKNVLDAHCDFFYAPLECVRENPAVLSRLISDGQNVALKLPRVYFDSQKPEIRDMLDEAWGLGIRVLLCTNLGHIAFSKDLGFEVRCDFSINAYNSYTLSSLKELGVSGVTLSYELMLSKIRDMVKPIDTELLIYGRQELMITENCLNGGERNTNCKKCRELRRINDRRGETFLIRGEFGCRTCVLNGHVLYLLDKLSDIAPLGVSYVRLNFTDETSEEISEVFSRLKVESDTLPRDFTRGLYYKGVM